MRTSSVRLDRYTRDRPCPWEIPGQSIIDRPPSSLRRAPEAVILSQTVPVELSPSGITRGETTWELYKSPTAAGAQ